MSLSNFDADVWSLQIEEQLRNDLVFGGPNVVNRKYATELLNKGDTVKVNSVGPVTVTAYVPYTGISAPETLTSAQASLVIDSLNYFNFEVDDVDAAQGASGVMAEAMANASYAIGDAADIEIATKMAAGATALSTGIDTTPTVSSGLTSFVDNLAVVGAALTVAKVPKTGRFCIITPWLTSQLIRDTRFNNLAASGSTDALLNGLVGRCFGFDLYESNNVPVSGSDYTILAGTNQATSYIEQINKVKAYEPEDAFSEAVKGLHVSGAKVMAPAKLVKFTQTAP